MTANDRPRRSASAEPRSRLPIPSWMTAWPRGVLPVAAWASRRGVELVFRVQAGQEGYSWFRVMASLGRGAGIDVRPIPGSAPDVTERLARAVEHHLSRSPASRAWLTSAREGIDRLASLRWFGGERGGAVDELLSCVGVISEVGLQDVEPELLGRIEQSLAQIDPQLRAVVAELEVVIWLAAGSPERALDAWARHGEAIKPRRDARALMCTAIVSAYLGDTAWARSCAMDLATRMRDPIDARHTGELLDWVGHSQQAIVQLQIAASDVNGDGGMFDAWRRLAKVAATARQVEPLRRAAQGMCERAQGIDQRREAAVMQREAGEFSAAEALLEQLLREQPNDVEGQRELASLRLWRGDHRGAIELAYARLAREPNDAIALRTLGAAEFLAGNFEVGLRHVSRSLSIDARDDEARLWRARLLDALDHSAEARIELVRAAGLGDHVGWQLLNGLVEEHAAPGQRNGLDTSFIVEQNIRQLLGDDAPVDTTTNSEAAVAAMQAALDRLGGNLSMRLTTPTRTGSLRWLDEVESPRRRSEHLQFQASHRPLDEILAEFEALAAAHPEVPFFATYSAELWLWRGEYERAFERFEQIWYATQTRWGYVGAGAAAMLLGRDDRALQLWEEGKRHYAYLDAEATYCYRGELLLRRGDLDAAQADLELATRARPGRIGAWIDLALLHRATGREQPMREAAAHVEQSCPAFVWMVRRELGLAQGLSGLDVDDLARVLERLRERMRGNRSSVMYTMIDDGGSLLVLPVVPPRVWQDRARRALTMFEGELLSELVTS